MKKKQQNRLDACQSWQKKYQVSNGFGILFFLAAFLLGRVLAEPDGILVSFRLFCLLGAFFDGRTIGWGFWPCDFFYSASHITPGRKTDIRPGTRYMSANLQQETYTLLPFILFVSLCSLCFTLLCFLFACFVLHIMHNTFLCSTVFHFIKSNLV